MEILNNDNQAVNNQINEKHRICKDCDKCYLLSEYKITTRKNGIIYRLHVCANCLKLKNKEYHQNYHKNHYISRKRKNI